ncbi:hypothetical protein KVG29_04885 [Caldicoprobacter algeriensis]|uniref:hypothetical protein n=1 Tax=Caldicoprobacter algeriensis TaxID=699281 RepID=UPI00207A308E|nr:hypothetical protein [Caldicoprobacter algeriensis]MCM8900563.1 hypothetical protein [Caldicoprobacter algeriensis]
MTSWFYCPYCGQKLFKVNDTARGVAYKCKRCKREVLLNVSAEGLLDWFFCPICGQKLCKIAPNAKGVYLKCKKCRNEVEVKAPVEKTA